MEHACSHEVERMCVVTKGPHHGPAPIPEEGRWVKAYEIKDISGLSHGIGWCAPQQGTCKLTLNVKEGVIEEALVETIGCSGMTHSAAMAAEILLSTLPCVKFLNSWFTAAHRPPFLKMDFRLARLWKTLVKDFVLRLERCLQPKRRAFGIWKWQKAMF